MFLQKKDGLGKKKLVRHGRESRLRGSQAARPLRLSPGGRSRPRLQAQALRLRVSGSLSLHLSPSLSPEALFRGSLRVTRLTDRGRDHSKLEAWPGPASGPAGAAGAAAAGSVTDHYRDDPWKT